MEDTEEVTSFFVAFGFVFFPAFANPSFSIFALSAKSPRIVDTLDHGRYKGIFIHRGPSKSNSEIGVVPRPLMRNRNHKQEKQGIKNQNSRARFGQIFFDALHNSVTLKYFPGNCYIF